jgi:hypothetical protein
MPARVTPLAGPCSTVFAAQHEASLTIAERREIAASNRSTPVYTRDTLTALLAEQDNCEFYYRASW